MIFEGLSDKLQGAFSKLKSKGKLTEKDLYLILESLKNSEILTVKEKKRFGFIL